MVSGIIVMVKMIHKHVIYKKCKMNNGVAR